MRELPDFETLSESERQRLTLELRANLQSAEAKLEKLEDLQKIFRLWLRLKQKLFPYRCRGQEIRGIDLSTLDADVAGCASIFLTRERLRPKQREVLYYCDDCLSVVTLELQGFEGWYFRQWKGLTSSIIEYERKFNGAAIAE